VGITPTIYFLKPLNEDRVKIGFTTRTGNHRRREAQTYNATELLVLVETFGSKKDEAALHYLFRGSLIHGEWFQYTKDIQDLVDFLVDGGSLGMYLE